MAAKKPELKTLVTKQISQFKETVKKTLPEGVSLEDWAKAANETAEKEGITNRFTAEQMPPKGKAAKKAAKDQGTLFPPTASNGSPSLEDLIRVADLASEEGGLEDLGRTVERIEGLASKVGGLARLKACLQGLAKLQGSK